MLRVTASPRPILILGAEVSRIQLASFIDSEPHPLNNLPYPAASSPTLDCRHPWVPGRPCFLSGIHLPLSGMGSSWCPGFRHVQSLQSLTEDPTADTTPKHIYLCFKKRCQSGYWGWVFFFLVFPLGRRDTGEGAPQPFLLTVPDSSVSPPCMTSMSL